MSNRDSESRACDTMVTSEYEALSFDLPRLAAVTAVYAVYVVAACLLVGPALDVLDANFPFAFFYHLGPDEADGPIGDPMRLATGMWLQLLAFWLLFAPLALHLRAPAPLLVAMTVLNEPIVLTTMVTLVR